LTASRTIQYLPSSSLAPYRPRLLALLITASVASASAPALAQVPPPPPPPPAPAAPAPPRAPVSAQAEIAAGDKAARTKDWDGALTHYQAAQQATPSWRAQLGVADALYQLGRLGESYETYDDAQRTYGTKYGPGEKGLVGARLKELTTKTGWLSLRVADAGADVQVDGKSVGTSPVPALIRVAVGSHALNVTKAGFAPFVGRAEVTPDGKAAVDVVLASQATQGHVVVRTSAGDALRVTVDGVDVGATPWEGDVPAGPHQIGGKGSLSAVSTQAIDVVAGARVSVDLAAASTAAHVQVRTNDGKGLIYIDGTIKGEGAFAGDVTPGQHTIVVSRDGYERYEKALTLAPNETSAETVTLKPVGSVGPSAASAERKIEGIYGGLGAVSLFGVGGMGTDLETGCRNLGATSCDTASPIGGGLFGYMGWTWDPVGFELMLGGEGDTVKQTAHYTGIMASGSTVPASVPARTEEFTFVRGGGIAAVRARATFQGNLIRGTIAGGLGASYKVMAMQRTAATTAEQPPLSAPPFVPSLIAYVSPALSFEGAIQLRASPTLAISLGLEVWAENASSGGTNTTAGGSPSPLASANMSANTTATPQFIPNPPYHLATGPQVMIGPFLGLQFGP